MTAKNINQVTFEYYLFNSTVHPTCLIRIVKGLVVANLQDMVRLSLVEGFGGWAHYRKPTTFSSYWETRK